jgi:hypothetical protein
VHRQPGQLVLAQRPHHRLVARVRQHQVERRQVDPFARDDRRTRSSGLGYCRASRYRTALSSTPSYRAIPRLLIPRSYNTPIVTTSPPRSRRSALGGRCGNLGVFLSLRYHVL